MATAKVFWSGNSQAVRLPKDYRFPAETEEVEVERVGAQLLLKPVPKADWPEEFWRAFEGMSPDFERPAQNRQRREDLGE